MFGYIVLQNLPHKELVINGVKIAIDETFEGFSMVPPGKHKVVSADVLGKLISVELEVTPGDAVVRTWDGENHSFVEETPERIKHFRQMAISGSMDDNLIPFPEEASPSEEIAERAAEAITQKWDLSKISAALQKDKIANLPVEETKVIHKTKVSETEEIDILEIQDKADYLAGPKTKCTDEDLMRFEETFIHYRNSGTEVELKEYEAALIFNITLNEKIETHREYFLKLVDQMIGHIKERPSLAQGDLKKLYRIFQKSMTKVGIPETVQRGETLDKLL